MVNKFKLGTNFDVELLKKVVELNKKYDTSKVTELYGSTSKHAALAARPDFRLPNIEDKKLEEYVKVAKSNEINFNYTLNSFMPFGSKCELSKNLGSIIDLLDYLDEIGVYRITVANPIMLEVIRKYAKSNIEIELSTCAHVDTITQIKYFHEVYGVNKICGNLNKNRDFKFLENAAKYCNDNGIIYELMANEFCGVGGKNYATHCIYRDSCYMCHATNHTYEDTMLLDNYPMNICTKSRNENQANWLRMRWIRPEDVKVYNEIGLNHFKITGRTGSTEYIIRTITAYLEGTFKGNLIELWKPLESIKPNTLESDIVKIEIDNSRLDNFIDVFKNGKVCDYEVCGETCKYCDNFYKSIVN